ncbi:MAG: hypothetical protein ACQEQ4_05170 [Fibrobacterota bacterium]
MKKLILTITAVCMISTSVFANARTAALGTWSQRDVSDLLYNPALMMDYYDLAQASASGTNDFDFFLSKQLSRSLYLGTSIDANSIVKGRFYSFPDVYPMSFPQFFMALDLGGFNLGIKTLYEFGYDKEYSENDGDAVTDERTLISTKGLLFSAVMGSDATGRLKPRISIKQLRYSDLDDIAETEDHTEFGLGLSAGLEARIPVMGDGELVLGGDWELERYRFATTADNSTTKDDEIHSDIFWNYHAGLVGEILEDLLWVAEYRGDVAAQKLLDESGDDDLTEVDYTYTHTAALAFEKPVDGFWIFDTFTPRSGFSYSFNSDVSKLEQGDEEYRASALGSDGLEFTTGFGLSKGRTTADLQAEFGDWPNAMTGPTGVMASLTVNFGNSQEAAAPQDDSSQEEDEDWDVSE